MLLIGLIPAISLLGPLGILQVNPTRRGSAGHTYRSPGFRFKRPGRAVSVLSRGPLEWILPGSSLTGPIPLCLDALSSWFILIIDFPLLTWTLYGVGYFRAFASYPRRIAAHYILYLILHLSLLGICTLENSLAFIFIWETMTISSFLLIIFEFQKKETLKTGLNFLIQSHIGVLLLILAFLWVALRTGYIFLFLSLVSGVYGVMLAIIQHNLKRLLAYHSMENIGIIGIGIGIGCLGIGMGKPLLVLRGSPQPCCMC